MIQFKKFVSPVQKLKCVILQFCNQKKKINKHVVSYRKICPWKDYVFTNNKIVTRLVIQKKQIINAEEICHLLGSSWQSPRISKLCKYVVKMSLLHSGPM